MKEHYVSFEQADKLKELGFDWKCYDFYTEDVKVPLTEIKPFTKPKNWNEIVVSDVPKISAARLDQAQAWLREHYGIHVLANPHSDYSEDADGRICDEWHFWAYDLINVESGVIMDDSDDMYESYEESLSAGISKALELLGKEESNGM